MLPSPRADLKPNTADFERLPLVKPTGFREYDARWLYPQEINLMGLQALGMGLGTLINEMGVKPEIVTELSATPFPSRRSKANVALWPLRAVVSMLT